jgi:hypothetical protein
MIELLNCYELASIRGKGRTTLLVNDLVALMSDEIQLYIQNNDGITNKLNLKNDIEVYYTSTSDRRANPMLEEMREKFKDFPYEIKFIPLRLGGNEFIEYLLKGGSDTYDMWIKSKVRAIQTGTKTFTYVIVDHAYFESVYLNLIHQLEKLQKPVILGDAISFQGNLPW